MFWYILITFLVQPTHAGQTRSCYQLAPDSVKVEWTAYKFTEKTAVKGHLRAAIAHVNGTPKSVDEMLTKTSFEVDALSVDTQNPVRDTTLRDNFFKLMKDTKITGRIVSVTGNTVMVKMTMNGITKDIKFRLRRGDSVLSATASIDILDFAMNDSFNKIQEACEILHKGADSKSKTWSTVDLSVSATLSSDCKP